MRQTAQLLEKNWVLERTADIYIYMHIYTVTSEWKAGKVLCWGRCFVFVTQEVKSFNSFTINKD